jgi:hypothetical protein
MEELDIKHQLHLLQKEVEAAVSLTEDVKLNLLSPSAGSVKHKPRTGWCCGHSASGGFGDRCRALFC